MFGWIPRWHPLVWAVVIILVIAVVQNPQGMGHRVGDMIHWLGYAGGRAVLFVESI